MLEPGKYVVHIEVDTERASQSFDVVTGETSPAPNYSLTVISSVDDKGCPVVKDDSQVGGGGVY